MRWPYRKLQARRASKEAGFPSLTPLPLQALRTTLETCRAVAADEARAIAAGVAAGETPDGDGPEEGPRRGPAPPALATGGSSTPYCDPAGWVERLEALQHVLTSRDTVGTLQLPSVVNQVTNWAVKRRYYARRKAADESKAARSTQRAQAAVEARAEAAPDAAAYAALAAVLAEAPVRESGTQEAGAGAGAGPGWAMLRARTPRAAARLPPKRPRAKPRAKRAQWSGPVLETEAAEAPKAEAPMAEAPMAKAPTPIPSA